MTAFYSYWQPGATEGLWRRGPAAVAATWWPRAGTLSNQIRASRGRISARTLGRVFSGAKMLPSTVLVVAHFRAAVDRNLITAVLVVARTARLRPRSARALKPESQSRFLTYLRASFQSDAIQRTPAAKC